MNMITGDDIVRKAREWLGTPYHHKQATKGVGCDCIGLVRGIAKELGLPEGELVMLDDAFRGYAAQPNPAHVHVIAGQYMDAIEHPKRRPGDIMLLRVPVVEEPLHFVILSEPEAVIHCWGHRGVVENPIDDTWLNRVARVYRLRGVTE